MSADPKASGASPSAAPHVGHGVRIFTYPKIIFIFPTFIAAVICGFVMLAIRDNTLDPTKPAPAPHAAPAPTAAPQPAATLPTPEGTSPVAAARIRRFNSTQNVIGLFFLLMFTLNMVVMALDFPRFTLLAVLLLIAALVFFFLWLNVYFDLIPPLVKFLESVYAVANAQFYFLFATIILVTMAVIYITRWLDYWEILPNEILHHHGPLSDLERYPTFNLKFDKEIPDVLEFLFLGAGRLVLHPQGEQKSIVLDNVLFINSKEVELKRLMSRMEVRVTTDKEVEEET